MGCPTSGSKLPALGMRPERSWPSASGARTRPMAKGARGTRAYSLK